MVTRILDPSRPLWSKLSLEFREGVASGVNPKLDLSAEVTVAHIRKLVPQNQGLSHCRRIVLYYNEPTVCVIFAARSYIQRKAGHSYAEVAKHLDESNATNVVMVM